MKVAIVTDSSAFLPEQTQQHPQLSIVSVPFIIDGEIYQEGIDLKGYDFYEQLYASKSFPSTSQPAVGEMIELYDQLAAEGYEQIISIHLSSGISGFVRTVQSIAQDYDKAEVFVFDSLITSSPMGAMVETALHMAESSQAEGKLIIKQLEYLRANMGADIIVDDLNNLVRGGRLTNGAALIGSLLKIKPILTFRDGKIVVLEKIRSQKKAYARAVELVGEVQEEHAMPLKFFLIHANCLPEAEAQKKVIETRYPGIDVSIHYFGPVIGTHLGEKALAIGWVPVEPIA